MLERWRDLWRTVRHRSGWEAELDEELEAHCAERAADLEATGVEPARARRQARLELGQRESHKAACRRAHGLRWLDEAGQDLRFAGRLLSRSPGFAIVAIVSLTLGVGANIVVFSVANALLLKPLGISRPNEVLFLERTVGPPTHSFPDYRELRDRNHTFAGLAGYRIAPMGVETTSGAARLWGYLVTGNYFDLLGIRAERGRLFDRGMDRQAGASPYAVLSHACWQSRFGGDPAIIGKTIHINAHPYTVLGIAPPGFQGTELFYWPDVWIPMAMQPDIEGHSWLEVRGTMNTMVIGRLAPGVTRPQAESDLNALALEMARAQPRWDSNLHYALAPPGLMGSALRTPTAHFTGSILALSGLVLLAACANLAGMIAARSADRRRELAVRLAIGAGRARIARQLLAEALLLSALGGLAGFAFASLLLSLISRWHAPFDFPVQFAVQPDLRVGLFAAATALLTGIFFGLGPARQMSRIRASLAFRGTPPPMRLRRWAFRDVVLLVQVALCCVLVTACFVALRGLSRTLALPLGWRPQGVAVASIDLGLSGYDMTTAPLFQRRALASIARLPGVEAAAFANSLPLSVDQSTTTVYRDDTTEFRTIDAIIVNFYETAPGYLHTVGTRLVSGRDFTWQDDGHRQPAALINQTLARRLFGDRPAVGSHFRIGPKSSIEIVGVVEDGKYTSLGESAQGAIFRPILQEPNGSTVFVVRTTLPAAPLAAEMRRVLLALEPRAALHGVGAAPEMLGLVLFPARAATIALGAFGVLAMMLALTGVYGLAAYAVSRRTKEISVRVAVGARPLRLLASILGRAAAVLLAGSVAGVGLGIAAGPLLTSIVPGARTNEPGILLAVAATMALVGTAAAFTPARRALAVEPSVALRGD